VSERATRVTFPSDRPMGGPGEGIVRGLSSLVLNIRRATAQLAGGATDVPVALHEEALGGGTDGGKRHSSTVSWSTSQPSSPRVSRGVAQLVPFAHVVPVQLPSPPLSPELPSVPKRATSPPKGPVRSVTGLEGSIGAATLMLTAISEYDPEAVKASKLRQQRQWADQERLLARRAEEHASGKESRMKRALSSYVEPRHRTLSPFRPKRSPSMAALPVASKLVRRSSSANMMGNHRKSTKLAAVEHRRAGEASKGLGGWVEELEARGWPEKKLLKAAGMQTWLESYAADKSKVRAREIVAKYRRWLQQQLLLSACAVWWRFSDRRRKAEEGAPRKVRTELSCQ
jgi:hypothetical protein